MIADCTAIILAGGDSLRMGRDKANLLLGDQTLLQRVIATMQQVFPHVIVSVRYQRPEINFPQVCDELTDGGPLAGLSTALNQITTPWAFVVACDMPFVMTAVIERLAQRRGERMAVVPVVNGQPQPLAAFYARGCSVAIREILAGDDKHSLRALLERLDVCYVDETGLSDADPHLRSFFDLDTPQDVAQALKMGTLKTG
ncbi:MAG: molybdenum cofactor guanylyltransferase [Nitrosomonadales bacterium]|nr:molybdenum cofactor guanylyltransferase [Nitrosomonadales bacterium]